MTKTYARIAGWGNYLPPTVLTNADLTRMVDTSEEWILTRSGIRSRHIAGPEDTTSTMAAKSARRALAMANTESAEVDLIILATGTPDHPGYPGTASLVQHQIGAGNAAAFDLVAGCSGWLYGLTIASQFVQAGAYRNILVLASETLSRFTDWKDRTTCVLFGDAAGGVLVQPSDKPGGLLSSGLGSDGSGGGLLSIAAGGSRLPASHDTVEARQHYITMNGPEIFRWAVKRVPRAVSDTLAKAGLGVADVDVLIPHQANLRIIDFVRRKLGMREEQIFVNIQHCANTSVATIPVALSEAADAGVVKPGHTVCLSAFGAGLTWATVAWKWNF